MENKEGQNKVVVRKVIHATRDKVFEAWTKPALMEKWFVGGKGTAKVTNDLRVGGSYSNIMTIDQHQGCPSSTGPSDAAKSYAHNGEYLEIQPPERLVFSWNSPSVRNTKVTVELKDLNGSTEVTLTHELLPQTECQSHSEGWTFALATLGSYLG